MSRLSAFAVFILFWVCAHPCFAISIEQFAKDAYYHEAKISPSGNYIAIRMKKDGKLSLLVIDRKANSIKGATVFRGDTEVGDFFWISDERLVLKPLRRARGEEQLSYYGELYAVNADGSKRELIFGYRAGESNAGSRIKGKNATEGWAEIVDTLPDDHKHILISVTPWSKSQGKIPSVYRLNVFNGRLRKIQSGPVADAQFVTNDQGELTLAVGTESDRTRKVFRLDEDKQWQPVKDFDYGGEFYPLTMAPSGDALYTLDDAGQDTVGLFKLNLKTGDYKNVYTEPGLDITNVMTSLDGRSIYALRTDPGYPTYVMLNKSSDEAKLFKQLLGAFPGEAVTLTSHDAKGQLWVVRVSSAYNPGAYYLYDKKKNRLGLLFHSVKNLPANEMTEVLPVEFSASDGKKINSYITLAPTDEQKPLPMVVLIHGGPQARDYWYYNAELQMLASQGYRVMQINYRGSSGYGKTFLNAGNKQWGARVQQDIIDGTRWAIEQGYAQKDKICIMGTSFGGYSAIQSAVLAPELYQCVVTNAGIYDLTLMHDEGDVAEFYTGKAYLDSVIGNDEAQLKAYSPINHINKLNAPVFIAHGSKDDRAPLAHAEALKEALLQQKKPHIWFVKKRETHGFHNEENQTEYFLKVSQFIRQHLKMRLD